jgi:serine/threonine-protein kinase
MATVFLAKDLRHGRDVALKVLHPELGAHVGPDRFQREIRIAASLQHPNILSLFDSGRAGELLYYVMPFVQGESLRDRIRREKQLPIPEAIRIATRVAEALGSAHASQIVHRDIKPENILLSGDNVYVADFGVARALGAGDAGSITSTGMAVGTPYYMSPEQATADTLDGRSDIYALGCVLYEMLAGEPPYTGHSMQAVIARHVQAEVPRIQIVRPTVPDELQETIDIAMSKSPADRFQTAGEFARALGESPGRATGASQATSRTGRTTKPIQRTTTFERWLRTAPLTQKAGALVGMVGLAAATWLGWSKITGDPPLDPNRLIVAPFDALGSGLDSLRRGLFTLVSSSLDAAGALRTVPPTRYEGRLGTSVDQGSLASVARSEGAQLGVYGTITRSGQSVHVKANVYDFGANVLLGELEIDGDPSRIQLLADSLTRSLIRVLVRKEIGNVQLASLNTASTNALKQFLQGEQLARQALFDSAAFHFRRATLLDTAFALAYQRLAFVNVHQGTAHVGDSLTWPIALRAGQLNRGLAPRESLLVAIDSIHAALSLGEIRDEIEGAVLRQRLFASLRVASDRFPGDAEVAFRDAYARSGFAAQARSSELLVAFDRAIALDSSFTPSYIYAIELAMRVNGYEDALRHINAYLRRNPRGVDADGMRLASRLMAARRPSDDEIDRLLRAASVEVAFSAFQPTATWPDSGETAIRIARRLANDPKGTPELSANLDWSKDLLAKSLAWRGHLREAVAAWPDMRVNDWIGSQVATLGGMQTASVSAGFAILLRGPLLPPSFDTRLPVALPFWSQTRDLASLDLTATRADAALRVSRDPNDREFLSYLRDASRAYRALAAGDSAAALRGFLSIPDTVCAYCEFDKITKVRLLAALGRAQEARVILALDPVIPYFPSEILWRLERARVAMKLGDRDIARREYDFVAQVWARADDSLLPFVNEAREALRILGGS